MCICLAWCLKLVNAFLRSLVFIQEQKKRKKRKETKRARPGVQTPYHYLGAAGWRLPELHLHAYVGLWKSEGHLQAFVLSFRPVVTGLKSSHQAL